MSTLNEGSGSPVEPTAHSDSDTQLPQVPNPAGAARRAGNGDAPQAVPPAPAAGGLPGLAGFAQTDAYARQPEPEAPLPAEEPAPQADLPPLMPDSIPPVEAPIEAPPEPAVPSLEEELATPVLPDEPAMPEGEPVLPQGEPPIPPLPEEPAIDASLAPIEEDEIAAETEQGLHGEAAADLAPADEFSLDSAVEPGLEADQEAAPETDDFSAFSKDSLERFLAGEGTLPAEEAAADASLGEDAFPAEAAADASAEDLASTDLQAFEARYDQHPEIPIGDTEAEEGLNPPDEPFMEEQPEVDADFLDGVAAAEAASAGEGKGRKRTIMVASALVGSLALGGALAFAYKNSGAIIGGSGEPPLIQADNKPVKQTPEKPGGKQFPHKNKLIYDRLQGEETPQVEKLVPRQEEVAAAVNDTRTAALDAADAEGPKKVKTLVVKPDGTVMQPQQPQAAAAAPPAQALAVPGVPQVPQIPAVPGVPAPPAAAGQVAAQPPVAQPERKPAAAPKPPTRTAAAPAPRAASSSKYVVQVAARKSQTDALAAFADLQQKYPNLLNNYRPIIERADLGSKGVWYRLRVGPLNQKTSAANLCRKLKSAGMSSCLVRSYSGS